MPINRRRVFPIFQPLRLSMLLVGFLLAASVCGAQEEGTSQPESSQPDDTGPGAPEPGVPASPVEQPGTDSARPPRGFRSIRLGMELEQVKQLLIEDPLFDYRGDPDISFLPLPPQTLIETSGSSFIRRAYFQFDQDLLYIIILSMDPDRLDYYTLYSTLSGKYGQPTSLDPTEAVWQFEGLRLSLERPLSVKYIDSTVFEALKEEGQVQEDLWEISKDNFLQQF